MAAWRYEISLLCVGGYKFQGFLMVLDLRSCTMLSTLPLFYITQSVNSDDCRARF